MATKKRKSDGRVKTAAAVKPALVAPSKQLELPGPGRLTSLDVVTVPPVPFYKQRRIEELTIALQVIRDALKSRFPEDPGAYIEVKPFKDGFTLNASGLDDDDAPADCTAVTLANAIYSDRQLIRRTSNRQVHRISNRNKAKGE